MIARLKHLAAKITVRQRRALVRHEQLHAYWGRKHKFRKVK